MAGMDESAQFTAQLEEAISARGEHVATHVTPKLKEHFRTMRSSFEAIHNVLRKKGLIKEDPYRYEERLSELDIPSDKPYLESERDTELSVRLTQYQSRLEFLTDYYDFSLENLDLKQLKMLVKFVQYINWRNLSDTATQPTTRGVAEQAIKIKKGTEQLSANIVKDAQEQLNRISGELQHSLKELTTYYREWYKFQVRLNVLGKGGVPDAPPPEQYDAAAKKVRAAFPAALPGQPFARELILEIFAENAPDGQAARETLLNSLRVPEKETAKQQSGPELKPILLDAARALAGTSRSLEEAARKLEDNALVLESRKLNFAEMLKQVWDHIRGRDQDGRVYFVDYLDEATNTRRTDEVQFEPFIAATRKRARLYGSIMSKNGSAWRKLQASSEDAILQFVTKDVQEVHVMVRRFESLDTYFRAEVPREQRSQLRGINVETTTIKDSLTRTRKKAQQYVSKVDELRQLKKLGIETGEI
jgi:hypothetical protein